MTSTAYEPRTDAAVRPHAAIRPHAAVDPAALGGAAAGIVPARGSKVNDAVQWRSRVRLVDEVAQELRERIYAGTYEAGMQLRQEQLAEELQVSRTPLREALRLLEREGLVAAFPGRGVRVVSGDVAGCSRPTGSGKSSTGSPPAWPPSRRPRRHRRRRSPPSSRRAVADWDPGVYTASTSASTRCSCAPTTSTSRPAAARADDLPGVHPGGPSRERAQQAVQSTR